MELISESQIEGAFRGWTGHSVYRLTNGQIWKQSHYHYEYHYAYRPNVKVWQDGSIFYLEVDGMNGKVEVKKANISDLEKSK